MSLARRSSCSSVSRFAWYSCFRGVSTSYQPTKSSMKQFEKKLLGNKNNAEELFESYLRKGFTPTSRALNIVITDLVRKKNLQKAAKWATDAGSMRITPNAHLYNPILQGIDSISESNEFLNRMIREGVLPDCVSYTILIKKYIKQNDLPSAVRTLEEMIEQQITPNAITMFPIIRTLATAAKYEEVDKYLKMMNDRNISVDQKLVDTLVEVTPDCEQAKRYLIKFLDEEGLWASDKVFNGLLRRLCDDPTPSNLDSATEIMDLYRELGRVPHTDTYKHVLSACTEREDLMDRFTAEMNHPKTFIHSYQTKAMAKYVRLKRADKCIEMYNNLREQKLEPTRFTFTVLMNAYAHTNDMDSALNVLDSMLECGMRPNRVAVNILLEACRAYKADSANLEAFTNHLLNFSKQHDIQLDVHSLNSLLQIQLRTKGFQAAVDFLENNPINIQPNSVSYCILLQHLSSKALEHKQNIQRQVDLIFNSISRQQSLSTDIIFYTWLLNIVCVAKQWGRVAPLIEEIECKKFTLDHKLLTTIVKAYIGARDVTNAKKYVEKLHKQKLTGPLWMYGQILNSMLKQKKFEEVDTLCGDMAKFNIPVTHDFLKLTIKKLLEEEQGEIAGNILCLFGKMVPMHLDALLVQVTYHLKDANKFEEAITLVNNIINAELGSVEAFSILKFLRTELANQPLNVDT